MVGAVKVKGKMSMQVMFSSSAVFLFMLLLTCCGSGGVVCAEKVTSVSQSSSVELFKKGETKVSESGKDVSSFSAHSLVDVNGLMVAIAKGRSRSEGGSNGDDGICSRTLKYEKGKMPSELIRNVDKWAKQTVVSMETDESHNTNLLGQSAVVKENKIYILLSKFTRSKAKANGDSGVLSKDLELVVGTVETSSGDSQSTLTWQAPTSLKNTLNTALSDGSWKDVYASRGKGLLMGGSTIVFPIGAVKFGDSERNPSYACTVIYSEDGNNWNFPSKKVIAEDCVRSTLLEQGGKLFMVTIALHFHTSKVYISTDKGKTWTEGTEADSNLLINLLKNPRFCVGGDPITATINNKNVALLTQHVYISSSGSESRDQIHLLMTDNKRITSVGPISLDDQISSFCTLLHTGENGELFALCNKGSSGSQSVVLLSLAEQLERIKFVLESWKSADEKVSSSCTSASKENPCSTPMPTSGLIGFLSNTGDDTHWADEYLGVNATVSGGAKVENGFKLSGRGAVIEWRFGGQGQNQLYSFADRGFTLVATVTIHDIPKSDTPLMTVGLTSKAVGLWYGKENHWKGLIGEKEGTGTWEKDKPYQVVITVMNGAGSVYIDGKRLGSLDPNFRPNKDGKAPLPPPPPPPPLSEGPPPPPPLPAAAAAGPSGAGVVPRHLKEEPKYICFGECPFMRDGDRNTAANPFTVTSVFLYNRVLNEAELLPPPLQQSQSTAKGTREATITGKPTVEKRSKTTPAGNDSSVHESLSSLFQLFAVLAFLGSATL